MLIKGRYPLSLYSIVLVSACLLLVLLANQSALIEASCYTLILAIALYIIFARGSSRFLLDNKVLRVYPLLSRPVTIDLTQYELRDYKFNFLSLDCKSSFFFTGLGDTLVFFHRDTQEAMSIHLNARMRDTRSLVRTLRSGARLTPTNASM